MSIETVIENYVKNELNNVVKAGEILDVEVVKGVEFLIKVLSNIQTDITVGETVLNIIEPSTNSIVNALTEVVSVVDALVENISNPASDVQNIVKLKTIWSSQKTYILNELSKVEKTAVEFINPINTNL